MSRQKIWLTAKIDQNKINCLAKDAGIPPLLATILINRGLTDSTDLAEFLNPSIDKLNNPFLLRDMDLAANRVLRAIQKKEFVVIYGDYDVDGITSTSILYNFLKSLSCKVDYYIPDRIEEGYGLSIPALDHVLSLSPDLIVTVDCGIVSIEETTYVKSKGVDLVITDHHEPQGELPDADAVVNPHRMDCLYPFKELAGVGVTFKLIHAVSSLLGLGDRHLDYLDLVTIGTIADVVPLLGENRSIVSSGLKALEKTRNPGLKSLMSIAGVKEGSLTAHQVAFGIAPRINAAGRLGDPKRAVKLFVSENLKEMQDISIELNNENRARQETEHQILERALLSIESDPEYAKEPVLVVWGDRWHHGVIGIVASRITEKYYKPSIVISVDNDAAKGSARSIPEFNLFESLSKVSSLFQRFGGHKAAAGLSLHPENLPKLRKAINEVAREILTEYDLTPKLHLDMELGSSELNTETIRQLEKLSPFGQENPKPLFMARSFSLEEFRTLSEGKHLKCMVSKDNLTFDAIGFNMGSASDSLVAGEHYDLAFYPEINVWKSQETVQINMKDLRPSPDKMLEQKFLDSLSASLFDPLTNTFTDSDDGKSSDAGWALAKMGHLSKIEGEEWRTLLEKKPVLILANSMGAVRHLLDRFRDLALREKTDYQLYFNEIDSMHAGVNLLVNPLYEKLNEKMFRAVLFAGAILSNNALSDFLKKAGEIYRYPIGSTDEEFDKIRVNRNDISCVYKYFTLPGHTKITINSSVRCSMDISSKFNLEMTDFKLTKILEILDQLKIINFKKNEKYHSIIEIHRDCARNQLENSSIFRVLNKINLVNI